MKNKIKVTHVNISDSGGGAAIATYRLHSLMNKSTIFSSKMLVLIKKTDDRDVYEINRYQRQWARISLYYDKLKAWNANTKYGLFSPSFHGISVNENELIINADIIYLHWVNNGFLGLNCIKKILELKKPVFLFCHDMWYFTGGCHHSFSCDKYEKKCQKCPFFEKNKIIDFVKIHYNKKKEIYGSNKIRYSAVCPSRTFTAAANKGNLFSTTKVETISNIIDESYYCPKPHDGSVRSPPYKLLFGALGGKDNPYKGWSYFIEALYLLPEIIQAKIEIILFGHSYSNADLESLPVKARSMGYISREKDMINLYQNSHIFVFSSIHESFGQTLLEAMACGVPSVAFPVGVAEELIEHKVNGYLAKSMNSADIAVGIEYLVNHSDYDSLSRRARTKVTKEFSAKRILEKHLDLINPYLEL